MNRLGLAFSSVALLLGACGTDAEPSGPPEVRSELSRDTSPDASAADVAELVAGSTQFATDLYKIAAREEGNLFMSPHSISSALGMTYAGARGTTASQIADVFGFGANAHAALNALDLALESRGSGASSDEIPFKLTVANSIWGQEGRAFEGSFLDTLAVNYGAGLHILDFITSPEPSRQVINGWVADKTNDKIEELIPEGAINPDTRLVLTNAIYFSAAWAVPFEAADTADRTFTTATGPITVPTMQQNVEMGYGEGETWKSVSIPYDGQKLAMHVVVPNGSLAGLEEILTPALIDDIVGNTHGALVDLKLPKFKFKAPLSLSAPLKELGMTDAFTGAADFSGIDGTRDLVIQEVVHEGFVAINEKGTEAAAATAVLFGETSVPEPRALAVDKPFLFFIRDLETNAILFIGRVVDPRE